MPDFAARRSKTVAGPSFTPAAGSPVSCSSSRGGCYGAANAPLDTFFKKTARSALMAAPPAAYSFVGGSPCCEALPWPRGCRSLSFLTGALRIRKPRPQLGLLAAQLLVHALELRHPGAAAATRRLRRPPCGHQRRLCTVRRPRPLHPSKLDMALCSFSVVVPPPLRPLGATTPRPAIRT